MPQILKKNKNHYLKTYIEKKVNLSYFYKKLFYSKTMFKDYLNSKNYIKMCNKLETYFYLSKLKTKIPLKK